ncbi:MAG TPA: type II secretion system minor pseudopilin GspK [Candidatus Aquabacterium excrementipullorum]|nr:type II secretion system minor pseudopilin GspK [Candidatus Aquabacterium excrementipullorum]
MDRPSTRIHRRSAPRGAQRGAALLAAMVIVTIVVTIASSMVWQQWRAVQVESAERGVAQSQWILRGALDWGRLILRADNSTVDHLGEPWAVPLAEARISSFLASDQGNNSADEEGPEAFLSGQIYDVQARVNLWALIDNQGDINLIQLAVLQRLCEYLSLPTSVADLIAQSLRRAWLARSDDPVMLAKLGGNSGRQQAPVMPQTVDQLVWLGVDAGVVERLRPYVALLVDDHGDPLPEGVVNLNTSPREVLAAALEIDLGRADRLVQYRQRNPFKDVNEISNVLGTAAGQTANGVAVTSNYFEITGRLRLEDSVMQKRYLVRRLNKTILVLFETTAAGKDMPAGQGGP